MKSTGNDIVALKHINIPRTNDLKFYSKILSVSEQALYNEPGFAEMPFENFVWLLWSVKESVYKYQKRIIPELVFSPTKIIIQNLNFPFQASVTKFEGGVWESGTHGEEFYTGAVVFQSHTFYFRSKIFEELIATVVSDEKDFKNVCWGFRSIESSGNAEQSKFAREFLLKRLNSFFDLKDSVHFDKSPAGYPIILNGTEQLDIPISLTHHHQFVAYSFLRTLL